MKIEIGESLVRSWLRHVEHCEFAELNWKPSPTWLAKPDEQVAVLFDSAMLEWPEALGQNTLSQFLKQAEIDVLGLSTSNDRLHLVDIAFHSGGLNYGGQGKTGERIYKKLVRSALLAKTYFPSREAIVYFITPKASPAIAKEISVACERAKALFAGEDQIKFELIMGNEFKTQLVDEVLALGSEVADTSELFLRSWQLIEPFINITTEPVNENEVPTIDSGSELIRGADRRSMHIAALYMSMYGHGELQVGNQTQTFAYLGQKYGVAANTVKNTRDSFDFYVDNHRVGWDKPLSEGLQSILDEFGAMTQLDLRSFI
jgi:hypothetical protein